jgi:hypothetical protein
MTKRERALRQAMLEDAKTWGRHNGIEETKTLAGTSPASSRVVDEPIYIAGLGYIRVAQAEPTARQRGAAARRGRGQ